MAQNMLREKVTVTEEDAPPLSPPPTPSGDIDGESLGSQDSVSEISEEEEEEYQTPPLPPKPKKRRQSSYGKSGERPAARKPRGNYRSWSRYRVSICEALRDAVFDKTKAAQILKRESGLYVPPAILAYYQKKLTDSFSPLLSSERSQSD
uniref:Encapsidation protein 22K n=1 Tax=Psittacine aviadenovirus B TaxID=2169709 RepID=A0AB38ZPD3_9ADEN